jgi:hypothetical protein
MEGKTSAAFDSGVLGAIWGHRARALHTFGRWAVGVALRAGSSVDMATPYRGNYAVLRAPVLRGRVVAWFGYGSTTTGI